MVEIRNFFEPKSVAIIGASHDNNSVGNIITKNMLNFKGKLFLVNLHRKEILGRKCYPSVLEINEKIDLAIICVPKDFVIQVIDDCGKKGIKSVVIITAGFSEAGNRNQEQQIIPAAKKHGIRIIGPNCFGVVNSALNMNTTFALEEVIKGNIAFLSQSGALGSAIIDLASEEKIGFSKMAFLGNRIDIDFHELIEYLGNDKNTKVIVLYIESLKNGRKFIDAAMKCRKPIIAVKSGSTAAGSRAALTHTASIAGNSEIYNAAFRQAGVIEADSITKALDIAKFISQQKEISEIRNVAIISNAGGAGVLTADYCEKLGLNVVQLPSLIIEKLNEILPVAWSHNNPIDMLGDADALRYAAVLKLLENEKFFDALICLLTPQAMTQPYETAMALKKFSEKSGKPVIASFMGGRFIKKGAEFLGNSQIMCFQEPKRGVEILSALRSVKKMIMAEKEAEDFLEKNNLPVVKRMFAATRQAALSAAETLGFPVVLKISSKSMLHKTEFNAVAADLRNRDEFENALKKMPDAKDAEFLVQKFVKGNELLVGLKKDAVFGHVLIFGLGGIYTEIFKDVSRRVLPAGRTEIEKMISETKAFNILNARGRKFDEKKLVDFLEKTAKLAKEHPEIQELDINPLIVNEKECVAADARIIL
ncbi:MAG: acetate--CoA ligase family protein [archaeon]